MKLGWMTATLAASAIATLALGVSAIGAGCAATAATPFSPDGGPEGAETGGSGGGGGTGGNISDAGPDADPTLGGPCLDNGQCDDGIACTYDICDLDLKRCRFTPDDAQCQNAVYCDGVERCDNKLGCR